MPLTDDIALQILAELREQSALLRQIAGRQGADDAQVSLLWRAAFAALGSEAFALARLVNLACSPVRPALQHAVDGRTAHALAKVFSERVGHVVDGLRLERVGRSRPAIYRLIDTSSPRNRPWEHRGGN
jgi:hypothetical protein